MNIWAWFLLLRYQWTPKPTHEVLGLPKPIASRILPSLMAITPLTPRATVAEILEDAGNILEECLAERRVPPGAYVLAPGSSPEEACVVRRKDGKRWLLHDFDDFIDYGLLPDGSRRMK